LRRCTLLLPAVVQDALDEWRKRKRRTLFRIRNLEKSREVKEEREREREKKFQHTHFPIFFLLLLLLRFNLYRVPKPNLSSSFRNV